MTRYKIQVHERVCLNKYQNLNLISKEMNLLYLLTRIFSWWISSKCLMRASWLWTKSMASDLISHVIPERVGDFCLIAWSVIKLRNSQEVTSISITQNWNAKKNKLFLRGASIFKFSCDNPTISNIFHRKIRLGSIAYYIYNA